MSSDVKFLKHPVYRLGASISFGVVGHICTLKFYVGQTIFQIITQSIFLFSFYSSTTMSQKTLTSFGIF